VDLSTWCAAAPQCFDLQTGTAIVYGSCSAPALAPPVTTSSETYLSTTSYTDNPSTSYDALGSPPSTSDDAGTGDSPYISTSSDLLGASSSDDTSRYSTETSNIISYPYYASPTTSSGPLSALGYGGGLGDTASTGLPFSSPVIPSSPNAVAQPTLSAQPITSDTTHTALTKFASATSATTVSAAGKLASRRRRLEVVGLLVGLALL
jgi:hypothetical protein